MNSTTPLSEAHLQARTEFNVALATELRQLKADFQTAGIRVDNHAPLATLIAIARHSDDPAVRLPLKQFETAIRPALEAYAASAPNRDASRLSAAARLLLAHFRDYTEVPIAPTWVKRVVIWWHQFIRRWRR